MAHITLITGGDFSTFLDSVGLRPMLQERGHCTRLATDSSGQSSIGTSSVIWPADGPWTFGKNS